MPGTSRSSLDEARAALKLRPDWEIAALFVAQVLQRRSNEEALRFLGEYLQRPPRGARRAAQLRAAAGHRQAITPRRAGSSRCWSREYPQNADVGMAVALLAMQANDYDAAETQLKRVLELNYKDPDVARFYLGQLNEERKRFDEALKWYATVSEGEQYIAAQSRYAGILAQAGQTAGSAQASAGGDRRRHANSACS